jgi:hypothetical protein
VNGLVEGRSGDLYLVEAGWSEASFGCEADCED